MIKSKEFNLNLDDKFGCIMKTLIMWKTVLIPNRWREKQIQLWSKSLGSNSR